jgi:hypothetical protein
MPICIGCGCDDEHACTARGGAPCVWIETGDRELAGICSECASLFPPSTRLAVIDEIERTMLEETGAADEGPAISYLEPTGASIESQIKSAFWDDAARRLDSDMVAMGDAFAAAAPSRLILPGHPDFHL